MIFSDCVNFAALSPTHTWREKEEHRSLLSGVLIFHLFFLFLFLIYLPAIIDFDIYGLLSSFYTNGTKGYYDVVVIVGSQCGHLRKT